MADTAPQLDLASKRVLVTGGGGFLGRHLVERLRQRGCTNLRWPRRKEVDLTSSDAIRKLFEEFRPEVVIHAAATVGGIGANRANPGCSSTKTPSWASS